MKEQNKNRDFDYNKMKEHRRKTQGKCIVEKINNEVSIGYLSLKVVSNSCKRSLQYHVAKGSKEFYYNGRTFFIGGD